MNEVIAKANEKDLFVFLQKTRLETAKRLNDFNAQKAQDGSAGSKFMNFFGRDKRVNHKGEEIANELNRLHQNHSNIIDEKTAMDLANSLFANDRFGLAKLIFAVTVILDDDYEYEHAREGLESASRVLYQNPFELDSIKLQLEKNYRAISAKGLTKLQKGILLGVAITALAVAVIVPVAAAGGVKASAAATTAALAAHGFGDMQIGLGVIALESFFLGAAFTGLAYTAMEGYNAAKIRNEFRSLSPEKTALNLAIQMTFIERIKRSLSPEEFKEQLDAILKNLNVLKGDLDYFLFVENEEVDNNKTKMKSFHLFDERLAAILSL